MRLYSAKDGDNWRGKGNWLSDQPVDTWFGVYTGNDGCVNGLSLDDNKLSGEIPSELGELVNLEWLDLFLNELSGEIPPELGNLASLTGLFLYGNQSSGEIPPELVSMDGMKSLNLHGSRALLCYKLSSG